MTVDGITETKPYLTFKLDEEDFAVDVGKVREVLEYTNITRVPQTPDFMLGVINLRGTVVPVIDMRLKFGMTVTEKTLNTCIIVIEMMLDGEFAVLGALTDAVHEVVELDPGQIEPAPRIGTRLKTEFIKGMGKKDSKFIIILEVDKVFSAGELELIETASEDMQAEQVAEGI